MPDTVFGIPIVEVDDPRLQGRIVLGSFVFREEIHLEPIESDDGIVRFRATVTPECFDAIVAGVGEHP